MLMMMKQSSKRFCYLLAYECVIKQFSLGTNLDGLVQCLLDIQIQKQLVLLGSLPSVERNRPSQRNLKSEIRYVSEVSEVSEVLFVKNPGIFSLPCLKPCTQRFQGNIHPSIPSLRGSCLQPIWFTVLPTSSFKKCTRNFSIPDFQFEKKRKIQFLRHLACNVIITPKLVSMLMRTREGTTIVLYNSRKTFPPQLAARTQNVIQTAQ